MTLGDLIRLRVEIIWLRVVCAWRTTQLELVRRWWP